MKKACKYCGKIHERNFICKKKPKVQYRGYSKRYYKKRYNRKEDIFRSSYDWQRKRTYILKRDKYLCQACLQNLTGTVCRLTTDGLSVHHIRPLRTDFDLRLDDSNLITLCHTHHELAENGRISAEQLTKIVPPLFQSDF
ncbi:MAG: HNH endonuclease [Ruminococcus sp.]|nr:HNH endonuclease [Ruminococcus sp.]